MENIFTECVPETTVLVDIQSGITKLSFTIFKPKIGFESVLIDFVNLRIKFNLKKVEKSLNVKLKRPMNNILIIVRSKYLVTPNGFGNLLIVKKGTRHFHLLC